MALTQRLDLRQTQSLVMTPQLQQAIKLLQLSNLELTEFVEREIEQNPLLDVEDPSSGANGETEWGLTDFAAPASAEAAPSEAAPVRDTEDLVSSGDLAAGNDAPLDADYENVWSHASAFENGADGSDLANWQGRGGNAGFTDGEPDLEQTLASATNLRDHLTAQLNIDVTDPADRLIGSAMIDVLDETGYFRADMAELAQSLGCSTADVERVLARMQGFDPSGIFARSLAECLAIQLRERDRLDPAMQALLDHLDLLAARNLAGLMRVCGVEADDLHDMVAEIKTLNPKPALAFETTTAEIVAPDILMRAHPNGGWQIDLNPDTLPRVLINHRYAARIGSGACSKTEREYLTDRLNSANWLVKSLHQRATTILKVATEIIRQQDGFFRHGVRFLKPLILRDIAEAIGMHESTVSRVTTNKFMATPRGLFELKYFFTSAITGADGRAAHSAEAVRFRIKSLIDDETATEVLSDDRIVEILRDEGIDIARRTVAKYREAMRIPSSVHRRRSMALRL